MSTNLSDIPQYVTIHGRTYKLKPFSRGNETTLREQGGLASSDLEAGKIDRFQYYDVVLRLVLEGPYYFDVNADTFDVREAEAAILSFLPPSMQAYTILNGFQSF